MSNPLGDMFGDIFNLLAQQGPDAWVQTAQQLALTIARGDDGDPNPSPLERQRLEELAPLVRRHLDALVGVAGDAAVTVTNRSALATAAIEQWRPLLAPGVPSPPSTELAAGDEALLAQISSTVGPLFAGFQMGSVAGHFAQRAWSLAVLPLPRENDQRLIVVNNLARFADEWTLERDEAYVFALAQEFVASLVLSQPGTGDALRALLIDAVNEAKALQGDFMAHLQTMMEGGDLNDVLADPSALLDGLTTPKDTAATRAINAAASVLGAYFDAVATDITHKVLGPRPQLAEAYARHRRSDARGEEAAAALFGISMIGPHHEAAARFVSSLSAAHGLEAFAALLRVDGLPSAAELSEPDAWYQRVTTSPLA